MAKKTNTTETTVCVFDYATANDAQLTEFIERNGINATVTSACVWFKDAEQAREAGATRCHRINTKKNRTRGNWYITRARKR